jgi:hypothetical protein
VECGGAKCGGERPYALTALAACYAPSITVGGVLRQMRCARGYGGRLQAAWPATGADAESAREAAPGAFAGRGGEGVNTINPRKA